MMIVRIINPIDPEEEQDSIPTTQRTSGEQSPEIRGNH
jgi:hypothetical protein